MRQFSTLARATLVVLGTLLVGSCGGNEDPVALLAPSPLAPAPIPGATIQGRVNRAGGATLSAPSIRPITADFMTVSVVGTSLSAPVGFGGRFTLTGVPAGSVQLHFTGSGVDAYLQLGPVGGNETLIIVVTVSRTAAVVVAQCQGDNCSWDDISTDNDSDDASKDDPSKDDNSSVDQFSDDDDKSSDDKSSDDKSSDDKSKDDKSSDDKS